MHTGDFYIAHVKSMHLGTRVLENSTLSTISLTWKSVFMPFHALGLQFLGSYLCLSKNSRSFSLLGQKFSLKNNLNKEFQTWERFEILSADSIPRLSKCIQFTRIFFLTVLFTTWRCFNKCWFSDVSLQVFVTNNFDHDLKMWVSFSWVAWE